MKGGWNRYDTGVIIAGALAALLLWQHRPLSAWSNEACAELEGLLEKTMDDWLDRHAGYRDAWAIDCGPYETIPAQERPTHG